MPPALTKENSWHGVVSAHRCCQPGAGERFPTGEGMASRGDGSSEAGISLLPAVGSWQLTTASQTSLLPVSTASFSHRSLHRPSLLNAQLTPGFLGKPCGGANSECVNGEGTDDQISEGQGEPCSHPTLLWEEKGAQPLPTSHRRQGRRRPGVCVCASPAGGAWEPPTCGHTGASPRAQCEVAKVGCQGAGQGGSGQRQSPPPDLTMPGLTPRLPCRPQTEPHLGRGGHLCQPRGSADM